MNYASSDVVLIGYSAPSYTQQKCFYKVCKLLFIVKVNRVFAIFI